MLCIPSQPLPFCLWQQQSDVAKSSTPAVSEVGAHPVQALPIFIDRLLTPVAAILLSVTAVLIVGEIIPQVGVHRIDESVVGRVDGIY